MIAADATAELAALARRLGAPVITSVMGRGAIPEPDPLWLGVLPNQRATKGALESADVILAVGAGYSPLDPGLAARSRAPARSGPRCRSTSTRAIGHIHVPALGIVGDARDGLAGILGGVPAAAPAAEWDWAALRGRARRGTRYTAVIDGLLRALRDALPADGIVVADQTGLNYWMEGHLPVLAPRTFLYPIGSATLGYGVPAAIGAKISCPDRAVVAVVGDGGLLFTAQELATAAKYRLPIVFVVMNDQDYGAIRYLQARLFGRTGEHALGGPDVLALARAFGLEAYQAPDRARSDRRSTRRSPSPARCWSRCRSPSSPRGTSNRTRRPPRGAGSQPGTGAFMRVQGAGPDGLAPRRERAMQRGRGGWWAIRAAGIVAALAAGVLGAPLTPAQSGVRVGQPAPEIIGTSWLNSEPLSLAGLRGRVVFVEFWTFGCANCQ